MAHPIYTTQSADMTADDLNDMLPWSAFGTPTHHFYGIVCRLQEEIEAARPEVIDELMRPDMERTGYTKPPPEELTTNWRFEFLHKMAQKVEDYIAPNAWADIVTDFRDGVVDEDHVNLRMRRLAWHHCYPLVRAGRTPDGKFDPESDVVVGDVVLPLGEADGRQPDGTAAGVEANVERAYLWDRMSGADASTPTQESDALEIMERTRRLPVELTDASRADRKVYCEWLHQFGIVRTLAALLLIYRRAWFRGLMPENAKRRMPEQFSMIWVLIDVFFQKGETENQVFIEHVVDLVVYHDSLATPYVPPAPVEEADEEAEDEVA